MSRHLVEQARGALAVAGHAGSTVTAVDGTRYLDFTSGWCVANLGWNLPALTTQLPSFDGPDYVAPRHRLPAWEEYADLLTDVAPGALSRCFRATGGSEAVDLALQAARRHTGRKRVLSVAGSYHGNTLATIEAADGALKPPLDERALAQLERKLENGTVAAFLFEPIGINSGILIPEAAFVRGLQRLCRRHGTLIIADEVACGFGRTGRLFACEHFGLKPDLLCLAKAITNGMMPMGALLATAGVARSLADGGKFYSTYGWHPRSVHAAMVTLRYLISHGKSLLENAERISGYCCERLQRGAWRDAVRFRVRGLAIAVDVGDAAYAKRIVQRCEKRGLLVTSEGGALQLLPPLTVERSTVEQALDILESCID